MRIVEQVLQREDDYGNVTVTVIALDTETGIRYSGTSSYERQWEAYDKDKAIDAATNKALNDD